MTPNELIKRIEDGLSIDFLGFLETVEDPNKYIGSDFLPVKDIYDYDWKETIVDNSVGMAKPLARGDAETGIISGPALYEAIGSVIGWGQKFEVNKKLLNKIFNPRNPNELKSNLTQILDNAARNIRAAQARREWLRWQYLAKGEVEVSELALVVDMGVPAGNKFEHSGGEITAQWNSPSTATPITDIIRISEAYYTVNNVMPDEVTMRRAQVLQILDADDTKARDLHSLEDINNFLASKGLDYPQVRVYDEYALLENAQGRPVDQEYFIPAKRIVFVKRATGNELADIGRLMMGPVAENNFLPGIYTTIYQETDPIKYWHFMSTEMWPAQFNPKLVAFADVQA